MEPQSLAGTINSTVKYIYGNTLRINEAQNGFIISFENKKETEGKIDYRQIILKDKEELKKFIDENL